MNKHDLVISDHRDNNWDPGPLVSVPTRPQLFLTDISPNGHLVHRGNPVSWVVDLMSCVPFLNFNGSGSQASIDAAAAQAATAPGGPTASPSGQNDPGAGLGAFGGVFGLAPSSVPGQAGAMGAPQVSTSQQPLASIDAPHIAAARPAPPPAPAAAAPAKAKGGGPFAYIARAIGGH